MLRAWSGFNGKGECTIKGVEVNVDSPRLRHLDPVSKGGGARLYTEKKNADSHTIRPL